MSTIRHFRELDVYQRALKGTLRISELVKQFPTDERFALTDQIRRSSRSVCANIAEAWRKRRYPAAFVAKLSDAETEAAETQVHAEIAFHHGYLTDQQFRRLDEYYDKIIGQLVRMIDEPEKWLIKTRRKEEL